MQAGRSVAMPRAPHLGLDAESRTWLDRLQAAEPTRSWAIAEMHERLRREAAFHIRLRVRGLSAFPRSDIDDSPRRPPEMR